MVDNHRTATRRWPLIGCSLLLATLTAASQRSDDGPGTTRGLPAAVARALCRIRESRGDVRLSDELWFEALPPGDDGTTRLRQGSDPSAGDILRLADGVFDTHRLSWRDALLPGMDVNVYRDRGTQRYALDVTARSDRTTDGGSSRNPDTRTFGVHRRRLQLVMLPVMYKLGVITTLLTGLTVLSLKGVTIGVILLILAVASVATKVSKFNHYAAASSYGGGTIYDPFDRSSAPPVPPGPDRNIHVHVHTGAAGSQQQQQQKGSVPYEHLDDAGAYWNRGDGADDYYDVQGPAAGPYGSGYNRRPNDTPTSFGLETSGGGAYHKWLG